MGYLSYLYYIIKTNKTLWCTGNQTKTMSKMTLTNKLELSRKSLTLMYERDYQNNPEFSGYEYKEIEEDISQRISDLHSFDRGKVYDVVTYSWEEGEDASLEDLNFTMSREDNPITQEEFDSIIDVIIIKDVISELPENPNNFDETFSEILNK